MSSLTLLLASCSPLRSVFSPVSLAPIYSHYTPVTQDPSGSLFLCRTTLIWFQRTFRTNVVRQDGVLTSAREQMLGHILPRVNWSSFLYLLWFLFLPYEDAPGAIVDIASIITFNLFAQLFNMASYILMASMTLEDSGLEDDRGVRCQVHKEFENRGLWIGTFLLFGDTHSSTPDRQPRSTSLPRLCSGEIVDLVGHYSQTLSPLLGLQSAGC
ncbi:MAG: hypothetical protein J3Q66DRAFT_322398, partial [Benniella sp.]